MSEEATIRRGVRNARYTTVPNHVFEDQRLSMEARWLLGYLLSKPDNWTIRMGDIRKKGGCGRDKARSMISELVDAGYAEREDARKDGKFNGLMLVIYDEPKAGPESVASLPQTEKPAPVEPATVQPSPVNPPLVKTEDLAIPEDREREGASARDEEGESDPEPGQEAVSAANGEATDPAEPLDASDTPGRAAFEKRVRNFLTGRGFAAGLWPDWDAGGSISWIEGHFARLTPEERREAERWRDAYLVDIAGRKAKPQPPGIWLRDKVWRALDPAILDRLERQKTARLAPEERAQPDGWEPCRGPVGMAFLFAQLIAGPRDAEAAERCALFQADPILRAAWPLVADWRAHLRQKGGVVFAERWHAAKALMEPVPHGTDMVAAWREAFRERGWPWLSDFDRGDVVYCPKGGPDGLDAFGDAVAARQANGDASAEGRKPDRASGGPVSEANEAARRA